MERDLLCPREVFACILRRNGISLRIAVAFSLVEVGATMARDTFIFTVEGSLELSDFTGSLQLLTYFVQALSAEIATGTTIRWHIEDLKRGSATAVLRGEVEASDTSDAAERVVRGIGIIAASLVTGEHIPYSVPVQEAAIALTQAIQKSVTALHLQTDEGEVVLTTPISESDEQGLKTHALGTLEGIVQTLQRRDGYVFTLYDSLLDRPIRCYLHPEQENLMREAWGKRVRVTGRIRRDAFTGRAIDIRDIWEVKPLPDVAPGSYKEALGILERDDPTLPEVLVRRLRDAE